MKIKIEKDTLLHVLKKASVSLSDAFKITVFPIKSEDCNAANILCCNDVSLSNIPFFCTLCKEDELVEELSFIVSKEFLDVSTVLGEGTSEDFVLDISENDVTISCGKSVASVGRITEMKEINVCSPKEENCTVVSINKEELKKAFRIGSTGMSNEASGGVTACKNALWFRFEESNSKMTIYATDGYVISSGQAECTYMKQKSEQSEKQAAADTSLDDTYLLDAVVAKVIDSLVYEDTQLIVFKKQIVIRDKNNLFVLIPKIGAEGLASSFYKMTNSEMAYSVTFNCVQKDFIKCIKVATVKTGSQEMSNKVKLSIKGKTLDIISDHNNSSSSMDISLAAGSKTKFDITLNGYLLKSILERFDALSINFIDRVAPVVFKCNSNNGVIILAPVAEKNASGDEQQTE